jgi:hypothetical protein
MTSNPHVVRILDKDASGLLTASRDFSGDDLVFHLASLFVTIGRAYTCHEVAPASRFVTRGVATSSIVTSTGEQRGGSSTSHEVDTGRISPAKVTTIGLRSSGLRCGATEIIRPRHPTHTVTKFDRYVIRGDAARFHLEWRFLIVGKYPTRECDHFAGRIVSNISVLIKDFQQSRGRSYKYGASSVQSEGKEPIDSSHACSPVKNKS